MLHYVYLNQYHGSISVILTLPEKVADTEITKAADVNIAIVNGCAQACAVYTIGSQRR